MTTTDVVLSWSGGKDSVMALNILRKNPSYEVRYLLTTVNKDYDRVSIHGVRRALLARQAEQIGVKLIEVPIPADCTYEMYQARMLEALTSPALAPIDTHAFADLFLGEVRAYRESNLAQLGKKAIFPVWGSDTTTLAREFITLGFRAVVVCLDRTVMDSDLVGRPFDEGFLEDLPDHVDPCGENGEFHTFVYDGPTFSRPVDVRLGEVVNREGFAFQDLLPTTPNAAAPRE
jgi:uncharacterized protein (TIGR00290 family)